MGIFGNIIENFTLNCFCNAKTKKVKNINKLQSISSKLNISIIPTPHDMELDNIYPSKNNVKYWNTFIVGKDKHYILSNIGNTKCLLSSLNIDSQDIVDSFGDSLPTEFFKFLDYVWTMTLDGEKIQIYIIMLGKTYFVNSYPIKNRKDGIVGAILFMRDFENVEKDITDIRFGANTKNI